MKNPSQEPSITKSKHNRRVGGARRVVIAGAASMATLLAACSGGADGPKEADFTTTTTAETAPQPGSLEYEKARVDQEYQEQLERIRELTEANKDRAESLAGRIINMTPEQAKELNMTVSVVRSDDGQPRTVSVLYHGYYDGNNRLADDTQRSFGVEFAPDTQRTMNLEVVTMNFGKDVTDGGKIYLNTLNDGTPHASFFDAGTLNTIKSSYDYSPNATNGYFEGNMGAVDVRLKELEGKITAFQQYPEEVMRDLEAIIPSN